MLSFLYIIQSKTDSKDKYQLHVESNSLMDNQDKPIDKKDLKKHFNDFELNIFLSVMYGDDEFTSELVLQSYAVWLMPGFLINSCEKIVMVYMYSSTSLHVS